MCGRIVQKDEAPELRDIVNLETIFASLTPRYNIAPSQDAAVIIRNPKGSFDLTSFKWGLVPHWAKPEKNIKPQINARSEGIEAKPFFRSAFKKQRALVPVSGFYEWKKINEKKQPYFIHQPNSKPFLLAGLWDKVSGTAQPTFAIITTEANDSLVSIHSRMPVVIESEDVETWLKGDVDDALKLLAPWNGKLQMDAVSTLVNSPANDSKECLNPISIDRN